MQSIEEDKIEYNIIDNINKINDLSFLGDEYNLKKEHSNKSELSFIEENYLDNSTFEKAFIPLFYPNSGDFQNMIARKTQDTTKEFNKRKRHREKSKKNKIPETHDIKKEKIGIKSKKIINENTKGRKKKEINYNGDAPHNKCKEDNIIRKIKTFIFQHILKKLNDSFKDKNWKFYRLNKHLNEEIKKDFNENLLERTIYDIYKNPYLNLKGKTTYKDKLNSELIDKIYKEKNETETISILKKTFKKILDEIREKDLDNFLEQIRKKEIKNGNLDADSYIGLVENVISKYENWFLVKNGRNRKK